MSLHLMRPRQAETDTHTHTMSNIDSAIQAAKDNLAHAKMTLDRCYAHSDGISDAITDLIDDMEKAGLDREPAFDACLTSLHRSLERSRRLEAQWSERADCYREIIFNLQQSKKNKENAQ